MPTDPRPFVSLSLPRNSSILVLAPHPDDFDSIGVTMRYCHASGHAIHVAVVSGSASGVLDEFCGPDERQKRKAREEEQAESLRFFGLPDGRLVFLRLPEDERGHPLDSGANQDAIAQLLRSVSPRYVFLPHGNDSNAGHRRVCAMFQRGAGDADSPLTAFYIRDPKTLGMRTDVYTPFGEDAAAWKRELLLHHRSQEHRNRQLRNHGFDDRILEVNRRIAHELGLDAPYAEAFEVQSLE